MRVRTAGLLVAHAGVCFALARVEPPTGMLDGGAEGNRAQNGGRGASTLTCGDIEANPGPTRRAGEGIEPTEDMQEEGGTGLALRGGKGICRAQ